MQFSVILYLSKSSSTPTPTRGRGSLREFRYRSIPQAHSLNPESTEGLASVLMKGDDGDGRGNEWGYLAMD